MKIDFVPPTKKAIFPEKANTRRFTRRQILKYSERVVKEIVFKIEITTASGYFGTRHGTICTGSGQLPRVSVTKKCVYIIYSFFGPCIFINTNPCVCVPIPLGALVLYASGMRDGAAAYFFSLIQKEKEREGDTAEQTVH